MSEWEPISGETPIDISGLKAKGITNRRELSEAEASNISAAIFRYLVGPITRRKAPFDVEWSLKLHQEMFGRVWKWAGEIRGGNLNLGVPVHQISQSLYLLFEDLAVWDVAWPDRVKQAVHLHYRAVAVHPFENGNGRWSRMLSNIWLRVNKHPIVEWPSDIGTTNPIRAEYLDCLRMADKGEIGPLAELHRRLLPNQED